MNRNAPTRRYRAARKELARSLRTQDWLPEEYRARCFCGRPINTPDAFLCAEHDDAPPARSRLASWVPSPGEGALAGLFLAYVASVLGTTL